jgi:hypothetical protein
MKIRSSQNRAVMNSILQLVRRPAVATVCLALILLAAVSYFAFRSPRVTTEISS